MKHEKDSKTGETEEKPKVETPLVEARVNLLRTGRSQQMQIQNLKVVLQLVDWAIETNWTPPASLEGLEFKMDQGFVQPSAAAPEPVREKKHER